MLTRWTQVEGGNHGVVDDGAMKQVFSLVLDLFHVKVGNPL